MEEAAHEEALRPSGQWPPKCKMGSTGKRAACVLWGPQLQSPEASASSPPPGREGRGLACSLSLMSAEAQNAAEASTSSASVADSPATAARAGVPFLLTPGGARAPEAHTSRRRLCPPQAASAPPLLLIPCPDNKPRPRPRVGHGPRRAIPQPRRSWTVGTDDGVATLVMALIKARATRRAALSAKFPHGTSLRRFGHWCTSFSAVSLRSAGAGCYWPRRDEEWARRYLGHRGLVQRPLGGPLTSPDRMASASPSLSELSPGEGSPAESPLPSPPTDGAQAATEHIALPAEGPPGQCSTEPGDSAPAAATPPMPDASSSSMAQESAQQARAPSWGGHGAPQPAASAGSRMPLSSASGRVPKGGRGQAGPPSAARPLFSPLFSALFGGITSSSGASQRFGRTKEPDQIDEGLFLGGYQSVCNKEHLQSLKVTDILTVARGLRPEFPGAFRYTLVEVDDMVHVDLRTHFDTCFQAIDAGRAAGGIVVHCVAGIAPTRVL